MASPLQARVWKKEVIVVRIYSTSHSFYVFGVYRNPDLSNKIFDCLFTAVAKVQSEDRKNRKASFLFVGDVKTYYEEWLGSSMTNFHSRAARDFASSSSCEQIDKEHTLIGEGQRGFSWFSSLLLLSFLRIFVLTIQQDKKCLAYFCNFNIFIVRLDVVSAIIYQALIVTSWIF